MKTLLKDTFILFVITLLAGALLGYVNELTKDPIAQYEADKKTFACSEVFYEADENGELIAVKDLVFEASAVEEVAKLNEQLKDTITGSIVIDEVYRAYEDDTFYGYVIGVTTKEGYNGEISFYVGITAEGKIKGVSLLQIGETPGLGMNAESVLIPQFRDVETGVFTVVKTGTTSMDEVDAISGATITSEAITGGVNAACECFVLLQEGGAS